MSDAEIQRLKRRWQADPENASLREDYARALRRSGLKPHYALIACIESNLEALNAVLEDIDKKGIPDILCLGGIIGSGPNPSQVVALVMERCRICIYGQTDSLLEPLPSWHGQRARLGKWIQTQIKPIFILGSSHGVHWNYIKERPLQYEEDGTLFVHGSPRKPNDPLLLTDVVLGGTPKLEEVFDAFETVAFNSQTHIPGVITSKYEAMSPRDIRGYYEMKSGDPKLVINVGSVGQPRDKDNRAGYVERIGPHIFFHRIAYDFERTIFKIKVNNHIDMLSGERLRYGT
ncbi:MAG: metallophosphoesterase family protein [Planctomycetota bacterium]|nr:metallophosphoesterase family protein [Planctomycetota bacterium]